MPIKANKGEWSEFYAFIKLLEDKKIFGADEDLEKIKNIVFPVLKIIREESVGKSEYEILEKNKVKVLGINGKSAIVDSSDLKTKIISIFNDIKNSSKTFSVPIADELIKRFQITTLNAGNERKEDLILKIHDHTIGREHEVGFSIKSKLGHPATLLNASGATNFTYKITGIPDNKIEKINSIDTKSKIRDRLSEIKKAGASLEFKGVDSEIFEKNLRKIDTIMPEIVAEILLAYFSDKGATFLELIKHMRNTDFKILNFNLSSEDYEYKIKSLHLKPQ